MILNVVVDDQTHSVDVPQYVLDEGVAFFDGMDRDLDQGWQMGPAWIDHPDVVERCQIAADRLLTALENRNEPVILMMAAYILSRAPGVTGLDIDTQGEVAGTRLLMDT